VTEKDRLVRQLVSEIEKIDPSWDGSQLLFQTTRQLRDLIDTKDQENAHRVANLPVVVFLGHGERHDATRRLREFAVERGWFEVPISCAYETLRMLDSATKGVFVVYEGKRGTRAVANNGQIAAQRLLRDFKSHWKMGGDSR